MDPNPESYYSAALGTWQRSSTTSHTHGWCPSSSSDTHAEEREHAEDSERGAETNGEERRGASMQKNKAEDESVAVDLRIVLATVLAFALRTWDIGYPPVVV